MVKTTLHEAAASIRQSRRGRSPVIIGVEGYGGAGKSTVAGELAVELGSAFVVGMDDFIVKAHITEPSWDAAFDRGRLESEVLAPAFEQRPSAYRRLEWDADALSAPIAVPEVEFLIVEGISAYHPSIAHYYDWKIWVDAPLEVARERGRTRDAGNENERHWDLWAGNDRRYFEQFFPDLAADFVIDAG